MSQIIKITARRLRPPSLPGGPGWVERTAVSPRRGRRLAKFGLIGAGILALAAGLNLLAADDMAGYPAVVGGLGLLGWGFALPLYYSVDLHGRGPVRSLLVTHDCHFADRISRLINTGLADPASMGAIYVDARAKKITCDPA